MTTATITDTGIRGFLKWFKQEQPGIYAKVAPKLSTSVPQAFSGYHDGGWKLAGLSRQQINAMMNKKFNGLGDDSSDFIDLSDDLAPVNVTASLIGAPATVDVAQAANTGSSSSSIASAIGGIIAGASTLYMTQQQLATQQQVVQTQLARAAAGLPPLPASLSNLGVPQVAVGLSAGTSTILVIGGAALLLVLMMSSKKAR